MRTPKQPPSNVPVVSRQRVIKQMQSDVYLLINLIFLRWQRVQL